MPTSVNADALVNVPPCANQEGLAPSGLNMRWVVRSVGEAGVNDIQFLLVGRDGDAVRLHELIDDNYGAAPHPVQVAREASRSNRTRLRSTPQAYPEVDPSLRITRWHGMATAILFAAQAPATARTAFGAPIRCASSA